MAEDGTDDVKLRLLPNTINSSSTTTNNIVSSILRKTNGFTDEVCVGRVARRLEQKIQELKTEKEEMEFNKCHSPSQKDQDSPIDFSVKRRTSFSGSLTDDSQTSSSSPGHMTDYSSMSPSADLGSVHDSSGVTKRCTPSPDSLDDPRLLGQPEIGVPPVTLPPLLSHLGVFPGISTNVLTTGSAMNAFSNIVASALKDSHKKKNSRPFKAYPKEALQMPLGLFGIPGLTSAAIQQASDQGMFMGFNNDDFSSLYHQQLQHLRDDTFSGQSIKLSTPSQLLSSSNGKHSHQPHHHQNQNPSPPTMTSSSTSPQSDVSDHLKTIAIPCTTFPAMSTPGSLNASLVSSTSSFVQCNSRKRPRSLPDNQKDAAYWERRRKNNDAAKRSRDARRAKEDEIAMRAALLEQENLKLRVEVAALKTETDRLRCMLYSN